MSRKFKTYYVSGINGDDCNNGEAPETAFGSLDRINNLELNPGDRVLLERGSVFENSGTADWSVPKDSKCPSSIGMVKSSISSATSPL